MTSDPNHSGLGELGQRPQAFADTAAETPRLRPYQSSPSAPQSSVPPPAPPEQHAPGYNSWHTAPATPLEPFYPVPPQNHIAPQNPAQFGIPSNGYPHAASAPTPQPAPTPAAPAIPSDPFLAAAAPSAPATDADSAIASGLYRALNAFRSTLPLVQRLLPLFESNIATAATAITALVAPQQPAAQHLHHPPPPPPAPVPVQVDLEPIERGLVEVRTAHRELRTQVAEQTTAIKRFEDQLEHVREATDRNTLEQQELVEDLRTVGSRVSTFAIIGLVLLVLSLLINTFLIVQMQHILR